MDELLHMCLHLNRSHFYKFHFILSSSFGFDTLDLKLDLQLFSSNIMHMSDFALETLLLAVVLASNIQAAVNPYTIMNQCIMTMPHIL